MLFIKNKLIVFLTGILTASLFPLVLADELINSVPKESKEIHISTESIKSSESDKSKEIQGPPWSHHPPIPSNYYFITIDTSIGWASISEIYKIAGLSRTENYLGFQIYKQDNYNKINKLYEYCFLIDKSYLPNRTLNKSQSLLVFPFPLEASRATSTAKKPSDNPPVPLPFPIPIIDVKYNTNNLKYNNEHSHSQPTYIIETRKRRNRFGGVEKTELQFSHWEEDIVSAGQKDPEIYNFISFFDGCEKYVSKSNSWDPR